MRECGCEPIKGMHLADYGYLRSEEVNIAGKYHQSEVELDKSKVAANKKNEK